MNDALRPVYSRLGPKTPPGMVSIGPGWTKLVLELDAELAKIDPEYRVFQVKAKFGGLCYYVFGDNLGRAGRDLITAAEKESLKICEDCGSPASLRGGSWLIVLCDECLERRGDDRRILHSPL